MFLLLAGLDLLFEAKTYGRETQSVTFHFEKCRQLADHLRRVLSPSKARKCRPSGLLPAGPFCPLGALSWRLRAWPNPGLAGSVREQRQSPDRSTDDR